MAAHGHGESVDFLTFLELLSLTGLAEHIRKDGLKHNHEQLDKVRFRFCDAELGSRAIRLWRKFHFSRQLPIRTAKPHCGDGGCIDGFQAGKAQRGIHNRYGLFDGEGRRPPATCPTARRISQTVDKRNGYTRQRHQEYIYFRWLGTD